MNNNYILMLKVLLTLIFFSFQTLLASENKENFNKHQTNKVLLNKNLLKKIDLDKENLSSPRSTMKVFLKSMKQVKSGNSKYYELSLSTINLDQFKENSKVISGKIVADQLVNIIDKIKFVDYKKIPNKKFKKQKWYFTKQKFYFDGKYYQVEIALIKNKFGQWLFSNETIKYASVFENYLSNKDYVQGVQTLKSFKSKIKSMAPIWTSYKTFGLKNGQWISIFFIILVSVTLNILSKHYLDRFTDKYFIAKNISTQLWKKRFKMSPISFVVTSGFLSMTLPNLEFEDYFLSILMRVLEIIFTTGLVWSIYRLVDVVSLYFEQISLKSENKFDDILVPMLRKVAKVFILTIGFIVISKSLKIDVTNLLAGLGIGGLAFALAAKDTLSNLFGSLTVLMDRPFTIGDWVVIGPEKIEGTVQEVGFRSTKIRTFYDSVVSVPNNQLTNIHIDNYGRREYRRFYTHLNLVYSTPPELIEAFCEGVRQIILSHPSTRKDSFHVYLNKMSASSVDIILYVFFKVPDWSTELSEKHRLIIDIIRLSKHLNVDFAYPTQTLFLNQENQELSKDNQLNEETPEMFLDFGKQKAEKVTRQPFTPAGPRSSISNIK